MRYFLDDLRTPDSSWIVFRFIWRFLEELEYNWEDVTEVSLDHDMGTDQLNGVQVIELMRDKQLWPTECVTVHSMNVEGRRLMLELLHDHAPKHLKIQVDDHPPPCHPSSDVVS